MDSRVRCSYPDQVGRAGVSGWRLAGARKGVQGEVPGEAGRDSGAWNAPTLEEVRSWWAMVGTVLQFGCCFSLR